MEKVDELVEEIIDEADQHDDLLPSERRSIALSIGFAVRQTILDEYYERTGENSRDTGENNGG